jgi:integrase
MRVQPIRDIEELHGIERMLAAQETERGRRAYLLFELGIYLARRVSDILPLKVGDLLGREYLQIREKKTGKIIELPIPTNLQRVLRQRLKGMDAGEYILASRQRDKNGNPKPVCRKTAYNYVKDIAKAGLSYNVGTHTMRKTFGYHYYQRTHDIALLMTLFNHSSEKDTKVYIGIALDEKRKALMEFKY